MDKNTAITLIKEALIAGEKSYSPYSKFRVGAALLAKDGTIIRGTNIENRSYGATICAERVALFKAVSDGITQFEAIAIVGLDYNKKLPPCGMCRQVISEFGEDIKVIISDPNFNYDIKNISELLPSDSLFELQEGEGK